MAETTLNISLTVNDEQLKSLIADNFSDLPKDKLQDIILQGLNDYIKTNGKLLFIREDRYTTSLNEWVSSALKSCIGEIAENNKEMLINTTQELLGKQLKNILVEGLANAVRQIFTNAVNIEYLKNNITGIINNMNRSQY